MCHLHCEYFCPCHQPDWLWHGPLHRHARWPPPFWMTVEEEIEMLENLKHRLEDELMRIDSRVKALKGIRKEQQAP